MNPTPRRAESHRLERNTKPSIQSWKAPPEALKRQVRANTALDCGWGRILFGQTFADAEALLDELRRERPGQRDLAFYLRDPHVLVSLAPQEVFLDPSHSYRLWLERYRSAPQPPRGFSVRRAQSPSDARAISRLYQERGLAPVDPGLVVERQSHPALVNYLAIDTHGGDPIGTVTAVDHVDAFDDPEGGTSLWGLASDARVSFPGVGTALVRHVAEQALARGRSYVDLSVMHDNQAAIGLYESLGFERVPVFCVKRKNSFNEPLYAGPDAAEGLNPYAAILVDEARRRGIQVEVLDADEGYFRLSWGGRSITCRESLSELTTAVALSRCDDKRLTSRLLARAGLPVADQIVAEDPEELERFLARHERVVVKPRRGEQGAGISVDVRGMDELRRAIELARAHAPCVLVEEYVPWTDLRVVVIDGAPVAAAVRRPAEIQGNGRDEIRALIETRSRRRAAATGGESRIPLDAETERCVRDAGYELDAVLPAGESLRVRKTANLHTGGTLHDVTESCSPVLLRAAVEAAAALEIPVAGIDLLIEDESSERYVIVEVNERPGLANHEPQPTAERFVDLLFPQTQPQTQPRTARGEAGA